MHAAAARPESVLSLTLIEPVLFSAGEHNHLVAGLLADLKAVFNDDGLSLRDFIVAFGGAIGLNLSKLPEPEGALRRHAGLLRGQRPPWDCDPSVLEPLRRLSAPKLVINGGRSNAMCALGDLLAQEVGAGHAVLETHGHDVQRVGTWINPLLMSLFNTEVI
jgi:hypothetical protein